MMGKNKLHYFDIFFKTARLFLLSLVFFVFMLLTGVESSLMAQEPSASNKQENDIQTAENTNKQTLPQVGNLLLQKPSSPARAKPSSTVGNETTQNSAEPPSRTQPSNSLPATQSNTNTVVATPSVSPNEKTAERLQWQWQNAPDDPAFLYENRYIPELNPPTEFISPLLQKEVIVERLGEGMEDYKKILQKYKPNNIQIIIFIVIILIYVAYLLQNRKKRNRRIFDTRKK